MKLPGFTVTMPDGSTQGRWTARRKGTKDYDSARNRAEQWARSVGGEVTEGYFANRRVQHDGFGNASCAHVFEKKA